MSYSKNYNHDFHSWEEVCSRFERAGHPIKGKGAGANGKGQCLCLLHDDTDPSMTVTIDNGTPLVTCHAGCDQKSLFERTIEIIGNRSTKSAPVRTPARKVVPIKPVKDFTPEWNKYSELGDQSKYTYCISKGVKAHGLRLSPEGYELVPMRENGGTGKMTGIQRMHCDKVFLGGTKNKQNMQDSETSGSAHIIGELKDGCRVVVCEGYATAATVYEATGIVSVCAFGVGNLIKVAEELLSQGYDVCISPDDDKKGHKARDEAQSKGIRVIIPSFENTGRGENDNDWNDLARLKQPEGHREVARQIQKGLEASLPAYVDNELTYDDKGNVRRLLAYYSDYIRYVIDMDIWMTFDPLEGRWIRGSKPAFDRMQDACAKSLLWEIQELENQGKSLYGKLREKNDETIEEAKRHQSKCRRTNQINASLIFASSDKRLQAKLDDFDSSSTYHLINFKNGTFDIKRWEIRPHNPKDMITQSTGFDYDPDADQSEIVSMVETMFPNPDTRRFLQVFAGYQLIGMNPEKKMVFAHGVTANNGKSTLFGAFYCAGGEYSGMANADVILEKQKSSNGHNESVARLRGKRSVFVSEIPANGKINENQFKSVTGNDVMAASRKNEKETEFAFTGTVMVATNNKPNVSSCAGMWQRILILPCNHRFEKSDPTIVDRLSNAKAGTMNWLLEGAKIYMEEGLIIPREVEDATKEYKAEQCIVQRWADFNVKEVSGIDLPLSDAYENYTKWILEEGDRAITKKAFSLELSRLGMRAIPKGKNQRIVFVNRTLINDSSAED